MSAPTLPPATSDTTSSPTGSTHHRDHQQAADAVPVRTVVCYLRTTNTGTAGQRLLGRQRAKLDREAAAHGWTVLAWIEDLHQSGATLRRPGLREALALFADHRADALLACDLARLAVTPEVACQLTAVSDRQGWQLLTVQTLTFPHDRRSP